MRTKNGMMPGRTALMTSWGTIRLALNKAALFYLKKCSELLAGCFSATTCANTKYLSIRGARDRCSVTSCLESETNCSCNAVPVDDDYIIVAPNQAKHIVIMEPKSTIWLSWQDFGTQVYHWKEFQKACKSHGKVPGRFVTPQLAEHVAGCFLSLFDFHGKFWFM